MRARLIALFAAALAVSGPASAQDPRFSPAVDVTDQVVLNGIVNVARAVSDGPGWLVIHVDGGGAPGPVAGVAALQPGENPAVEVRIDTAMLTPVLYAMLHTDDGQIGAYEFDGQSGLDNPVSAGGQVIAPAFSIAALDVTDQRIDDGQLRVRAVTAAVPLWVVIHSDADGAPGPVLGHTALPAGTSSSIAVPIAEAGRTATLWPMLHVDDGAPGVYEFDGQSGRDNPVIVSGVTATGRVWTVPHARVPNQIILRADNAPPAPAGHDPVLRVDSTLCDGPCFMVVHTDGGGMPGPAAGFVALPDGLSEHYTVPLNMGAPVTAVLWPMLHADDGTVGTYEFDGQSGRDNPIMVDGAVVTFPIHAAPMLQIDDQPAADGIIRVAQALTDSPGWLVIHQDSDGAPGPVLGFAALRSGLTRTLTVTVDAAAAGARVFPMLHFDSGAAGVYEFGSVPGADVPVVLAGRVITSPSAIPAP